MAARLTKSYNSRDRKISSRSIKREWRTLAMGTPGDANATELVGLEPKTIRMMFGFHISAVHWVVWFVLFCMERLWFGTVRHR